ncbi:MAG TPA: DinB family protein [Herpetosiphonaceae bacterium]|nr:DinB family protein [Herpetosiphonaceae bacterium]
MEHTWRSSVWQQYGAAIAMLEDAITRCPDQVWEHVLWHDPDDARYGQFWFIAYHTLFWVDLFLTGSQEGFAPPAPFIRGRLPEQPYAKDQILSYLSLCRQRCHATIAALTEEQAQRRCVFPWMEPSFLELQIYGMRHVQEHAGQLSLALGQQGVTGMDWIARAPEIEQ